LRSSFDGGLDGGTDEIRVVLEVRLCRVPPSLQLFLRFDLPATKRTVIGYKERLMGPEYCGVSLFATDEHTLGTFSAIRVRYKTNFNV
jgi:hypothetical protein